jgi:regulator of protease activity HflC (stomatin/prohibitin superfamily)
MASAFAWIGQIVEWLGQFFPRWLVVENTHGGVKTIGSFFRRGTKIVAVGPGLVWFWPATTRLEIFPTCFQTDNLPSQTIETSDGTSVVVGGMISYRVADVARLLTELHSPVMAIRTVALPAIHRTTCRMEWEELKREQRAGTLNTKLRNSVRGTLRELGVEVESLELTDMTKAKALRLIQSTQNDMEA